MTSDLREIITQEEYLELKEAAGHLSIAKRINKIEPQIKTDEDELIKFLMEE